MTDREVALVVILYGMIVITAIIGIVKAWRK